METLKTIGIAFIISFIVVSGLNFLSNTGIGATITQISGGDKLSDLDTLINTISSELNVAKMEISTTTLPLLATLAGLTTASSLAIVGTITTGTWNADVLTVTYGGTGLATLSANQVLLGNGTGNIAFVSGLGNSGQFLTSNGAGTPPTWTTSAVDEGIDYNWTGHHTFVSAFFTEASSTNATSTNLTVTGHAIFSGTTEGLTGLINTDFSGTSVSNSTTETALCTFSLPANTLRTDRAVKLVLPVIEQRQVTSGGSDTATFRLKYGATTVATFTTADTSANSGAAYGVIEAILFANAATNAQVGTIRIDIRDTADGSNQPEMIGTAVGSATEDSTGALTLQITVQYSVANANNSIAIDNCYAVFL